MADKFDPYRESLVVETSTSWPEEQADMSPAEMQRIAEALHADPEKCAGLRYVRVTTGFCRHITATPEDIERISQ